MQKFAHLVKTAEIRGVMAYLVDSEMVKVASEEDFDALVNEVADAIGDEQYDLNTVLNKTAELIGGEDSQEKVASEDEELVAEIGALTLDKIAGRISDEEYESILKEASVAELTRRVAEQAARKGSGVQAPAATGIRGRLSDAGSYLKSAPGAAYQKARGAAAAGQRAAASGRDAFLGRGLRGTRDELRTARGVHMGAPRGTAADTRLRAARRGHAKELGKTWGTRAGAAGLTGGAGYAGHQALSDYYE